MDAQKNPNIKVKGRKELDAPRGRKCPVCHFINKSSSEACISCGFQWPEYENITCERCGQSNKKTNVSCCRCGHIFNEHNNVLLREVVKQQKHKKWYDRDRKTKLPKYIDEIEGDLFVNKNGAYYINMKTGEEAHRLCSMLFIKYENGDKLKNVLTGDVINVKGMVENMKNITSSSRE